MRKLFAFIIVISIFMILIPNTYAWGGPSNEIGSHYAITSFSFDYIAKYFKALLDFKLYNEEYINTIKHYSYDSDIHESRKGTHYYVYKDIDELYHKNRFGQIQKSAKLSFEEHYMMALYQYNAGLLFEAAKSLGRAIHYLEDMTCPVHTLGISGRELHHNFELYTTININKFLGFVETGYKDGDISEYAAKISSDNKYKEAILNHDWDLASSEMIPFASSIVIDLLKKFIDDVLSDLPKEVLIDGSYQAIKITKKGFIIGNDNRILTYRGKIKKTLFKKYHRIAIAKNSIRISIGRKYIKSLRCDMRVSPFEDDRYLFNWR